MANNADYAAKVWRATLFGREGELAFIQVVPSPPPLVISVPVNRPVIARKNLDERRIWTGERKFELVWSAYPRADYRETN